MGHDVEDGIVDAYVYTVSFYIFFADFYLMEIYNVAFLQPKRLDVNLCFVKHGVGRL
jgi:hypothetical protein